MKTITIRLTPEQRRDLEPLYRATMAGQGSPIAQLIFRTDTKGAHPRWEVGVGLIPRRTMKAIACLVENQWLDIETGREGDDNG